METDFAKVYLDVTHKSWRLFNLNILEGFSFSASCMSLHFLFKVPSQDLETLTRLLLARTQLIACSHHSVWLEVLEQGCPQRTLGVHSTNKHTEGISLQPLTKHIVL